MYNTCHRSRILNLCPKSTITETISWVDSPPRICHDWPKLDVISGPVIPFNIPNKIIINFTSHFALPALGIKHAEVQSEYCSVTYPPIREATVYYNLVIYKYTRVNDRSMKTKATCLLFTRNT